MYGSASTAITKRHRVGGLNNRRFSLTVLEAGSLRSGGQLRGFSARAFFRALRTAACLLRPHVAMRVGGTEGQTGGQCEKARGRVRRGAGERDRKRGLSALLV